MAKNRIAAMVMQRCPVCLEGKAFRSMLGMNPDCSVCGIHFERESGYFLNAMFFAYVIGFFLFAPLALVLYLTGVPAIPFSIIMVSLLLVSWPLIFRYSRILWMHVDQLIDSRDRPDAQPVQTEDKEVEVEVEADAATAAAKEAEPVHDVESEA